MTRLALFLAMLAAPAVAEEQTVCMPLPILTAALAGKYGERPAAEGVIKGNTSRLVVWANPDTGTWTAAVVTTGGMACMIGSGEGWDVARAKVEERAS